MANEKTFIGYDLGDGESITDVAVLNVDQSKNIVHTDFQSMTMPDCKDPGRAIPTVFAIDKRGKLVFTSSVIADISDISQFRISFKRRPTDLMPALDAARRERLLAMFRKEEGWPSKQECPEAYTEGMCEFRAAVVTFTNAVFENAGYLNRIRSIADGSNEIVFCVGHPTKWDELDVAVYKAVLAASVLGRETYAGKKASLVMAAESRAAFLYVKDRAISNALPRGTSALLIDVGSSTIDVTAMEADSRNHQFNSGNNYLGARSIDFAIRDWYLNQLRQNADNWRIYQSSERVNPCYSPMLTLFCRRAKEDIYSVAAGKTPIYFDNFPPVLLTRDLLEKILEESPVGKILQDNVSLPAAEAQAMGGGTWKRMYREFLTDQKAQMEAKGIRIGRVIMTGSASRMTFVPEITREVFSELKDEVFLEDMDPSRTISKGLALVGPSNEKSRRFQEDLARMLEREIPETVKNDMPALAEKLGETISGIVTRIAKDRILMWRRRDLTTLHDMSALIARDCSEESLGAELQRSAAYQSAVKNWVVETVGKDIAVKLGGLCEKYGVSGFKIEDLNVMKFGGIGGIPIHVDPIEFADSIVAIVSIIAGIVAALILPTVLGIAIGLISWVSAGLAGLLLSILLAIPGAGWAILLGIAGIAVIIAASKGLGNAKQILSDKLQGVDLPQWVRNRMSDEKIDEKLREAGLKEKIKKSILAEDSQENIIAAVMESLRGQIEKRAEDIKYVIESK